MEMAREKLQKIHSMLKAMQYSTRELDDGCETCGYGATILRECPLCNHDDPGHYMTCELWQIIKELDKCLT